MNKSLLYSIMCITDLPLLQRTKPRNQELVYHFQNQHLKQRSNNECCTVSRFTYHMGCWYVGGRRGLDMGVQL